MRIKRIVGLALASALATGGMLLASGPAGADVEGLLVSCNDGSSGTLIGSAKISPGLTTVQKKQTISTTLTLSNCTANEAELDEIAISKLGVSKARPDRPAPITNGTAKVKLTTYGDCLGLATPDPDDTGEYPLHGTVQATWLTASALKAAKSTAFVRGSIAGTTADLVGIVTKGLGIGADYQSTANFSPTHPDGDTNENGQDDFLDCVLFNDPTAVGKYVQVVTPADLSITLPTTP